MAEDPADFYSRGAKRFAENNAMEKLPGEYIELLDTFLNLVPGKKVLDAGCGPGRDTNYFSEQGFDAVGVDLAEDMVEYAKENMEGEYHRMDVKDLEFEDESFDGVWCNTVLIFFPPDEMKEVIDELCRVLEDGGVLYVSFKTGKDDFLIREKYGSEVKQHLLEKQEAEEMLRDKGLEIVELRESQTNGGFDIANIICRKTV